MHTRIILALALTPALAHAQLGSLAPPAGAVTETMKPLDVVEARTPVGPETTPGDADNTYIISEPGSYYLVENFAGEPAKNGISILSGNVTLDLNGFTVDGSLSPRSDDTPRDEAQAPADRGGSSPRNGIDIVSFQSAVHVKNGTVSNWDGSGIAFTSDGGIVSDVALNNNRLFGISASATFGAQITGCTGVNNGGRDAAGDPLPNTGHYRSGNDTIITRCTAFGGNIGYVLEGDSTLTHCSATNFRVSGVNISGANARVTDTNLRSSNAGVRSGITVQNTAQNAVIEDVSISGLSSDMPFGIETSAPYTRLANTTVHAVQTGVSIDAGFVQIVENSFLSTTGAAVAATTNATALLVDSNRFDTSVSGLTIDLQRDIRAAVIRNIAFGGIVSVSNTDGNTIPQFFSPDFAGVTSMSNILY